jgi:DNA-binding CsgD family transcriptional regulator
MKPGRFAISAGGDTAVTEPRLISSHQLSELQCLYAISELVERQADSLPDILQGIVDLLARSWQYPELCHARVTLREQRYETEAFRKSFWRQAAPIRVQSQTAGSVEVFYQEATPECDEGPFLRAERDLINAVAARVGRIAERFLLTEELATTRKALQEAKAALRGILSQINEERAEIGRSINANVEKALLPQLQVLARQASSHQKQCLTLLQKGLTELTDPFTRRISSACRDLTPTEIEICSLIRNGLSTKEIARVRQVTPATVFKQRESIRRKLSISGTNTNLTAHLLAVAAKTANI